MDVVPVAMHDYSMNTKHPILLQCEPTGDAIQELLTRDKTEIVSL
jgi:hypothetical protein